MTVSGLDDPFIPLAFSMYSTPSAYAVIAGAGVSIGANLPTAWDIVVDLAQKFCRARGDVATADAMDSSNVEQWYADTFATDLTYSGILEAVAPLQHEREAVLRDFFEPMGNPSEAHHAVARLAAAGVIKVVVTMNFDHLFEQALREVGIDPLVVATESQAAGSPPLQTIKPGSCLVVHLHGSYRDPTSMLNTTTELDHYNPAMQSLLNSIVQTHGLLIAGWSAQHDRALRETLQREHRQFYTPGWINPRPLTGEAKDLAIAIGAPLLEATADEAFSRLEASVAAMRTRAARHPLTAAIVVDRIKTELDGGRPAIRAHDTFTAEVSQLDTCAAVTGVNFSVDDYLVRLQQIDEACRVPAAATATLARWGAGDTDDWWLPIVEQWSHSFQAGGNTNLIDLPLMVGTRLFYAAGIGAIAARRYDMLAQLCALEVHRSGHQTKEACHWLAWDERHTGTGRATTNPLRDGLAATLGDALGLSPKRLDIVWQEFETLRVAARILTAPEFFTRLQAVWQADSKLDSVRLLANAGQVVGQQIQEGRENVDRARADVARLGGALRPHIHVEETNTPGELNEYPWISPVAQQIAKQPDRFTALGVLAPSTAVNKEEAVAVALRAAVTAFHLVAVNMNGAHHSRSEMWLDTPQPGS